MYNINGNAHVHVVETNGHEHSAWWITNQPKSRLNLQFDEKWFEELFEATMLCENTRRSIRLWPRFWLEIQRINFNQLTIHCPFWLLKFWARHFPSIEITFQFSNLISTFQLSTKLALEKYWKKWLKTRNPKISTNNMCSFAHKYAKYRLISLENCSYGRRQEVNKKKIYLRRMIQFN